MHTNTCLSRVRVAVHAQSSVRGETVLQLDGGRWWIFTGVIVNKLTATIFLLSAADEDNQASNVDGKQGYQEDVNNPGSSLHTQRKGGWRVDGSKQGSKRHKHKRTCQQPKIKQSC